MLLLCFVLVVVVVVTIITFTYLSPLYSDFLATFTIVEHFLIVDTHSSFGFLDDTSVSLISDFVLLYQFVLCMSDWQNFVHIPEPHLQREQESVFSDLPFSQRVLVIGN